MAQMTTTIETQLPPKPGLVTSVGLVADRLMRSVKRGGSGAELDQRALLERLLAVAAEAEQRIAEQSQRIALLEALSVTDELTGLINRRGFSRELRRALAEAKRFQTSGILAYMDVDDFKKVNDIFGHQAGDELLHRVAELLASNVRATDVVARLGGDEFAVLLTNSPVEDGFLRAREIERLVNSTVVRYADQEITVHASFGAVSYDGEDDDESLTIRADRAMYANKHRDERVLRPRFPRRGKEPRQSLEQTGGA